MPALYLRIYVIYGRIDSCEIIFVREGGENGRFFEKEDDWGRGKRDCVWDGKYGEIRSCWSPSYLSYHLSFICRYFLLLLFILFYVISCYLNRFDEKNIRFLFTSCCIDCAFPSIFLPSINTRTSYSPGMAQQVRLEK